MTKGNRPVTIIVLRCAAGDHVYFTRQLGLWADQECDHCAANNRLRLGALDERAWSAVIGLQTAWVHDQTELRRTASIWGWREKRDGHGVVVTHHGVIGRAERVAEPLPF